MKNETKTTTRRRGGLERAYSRLFAPIRGHSRLFAVGKWQLFLPFRPRAFGFVRESALCKYRQIPLDTAKYRLKKSRKPTPQAVVPHTASQKARVFGLRASDFIWKIAKCSTVTMIIDNLLTVDFSLQPLAFSL